MNEIEGPRGRSASVGRRRSCIGFVLLLMSAVCNAQGAPTPQGFDLRYDTLLKSPDRKRTTPGNEFGDQHGIESGSLTFNIVDVSVPGNSNLAVEFRRVLDATDQKRLVGYSTYAYPVTVLGDWRLGLPRIQATYDSEAGWITTETSRPTKNCSLAQKSKMAPPPGTYAPDSFPANSFWSSPTVQFPDGSSRLLVYNEALLSMPTTGGPYFWVTADHDVVACLPTLKNRNDASADPEERLFGQGEGYLLTRADGTKYWFDQMALEGKVASFSSITQTFCGQGCQTISTPVFLEQAMLALYPTRVEDRFGNWVSYTYSNKTNGGVKLDKIEANDGRRIDIAYDANSVVVTSHLRSWRYSFTDSRLSQVLNPDSSTWNYSGESHPLLNWPYPTTGPEGRCQNLEWTDYVNTDHTIVGDTDFPGYTVKNPSGATAVFRVGGTMLGRSNVPGACYETGRTVSAGLPFQITAPLYFLGSYRLALTGKKVTGPGLTPMIWKYSYQSDIGFAPMSGGSTRTKILNPDGSMDFYKFGNSFSSDEGLQLSYARSVGQQVAVSETNAYAIGTAAVGFPKRIGYHIAGDDRTGDMLLRPTIKTEKSQQSRIFSWKVDMNCAPGTTSPCLDARGRPTKVTKSSFPQP